MPDDSEPQFITYRELHAILDEHVTRREFDLRAQTVDDSITKAFAANALLVDSRFAASQEAIEKADRATEKRFESVNEFRGQLSDQARLYATRESLEAWTRESRLAHESLATQINEQARVFVSRETVEAQNKELRNLITTEEVNITTLSNRVSNIEGRVLAYAGAVGVAVSIFSVLVNVALHSYLK